MSNKVLFFTDSLTFGGVEKVILQLIEGLDPDLWQPVLICHPSQDLLPLIQKADQLGVRKIEIPEMPLGQKGVRKMARLLGVLCNERPEIFHAHLSWPLACKWGLVAAILALVPGLVITEHLFLQIPYSKAARLQQRLIAVRAAKYIADSHAIADNLLRVFGIPGHKIRVIHNGVDPANFQNYICPPELDRLSQDLGKPIILAVARLHEQKGLGYLIEAAKDVPEAIFAIVGDGPERFALEQRVGTLGLRERVFFFGFRSDTPNWLGACTAFVLPSLYEGFPIALLEAMAAGKPVIATAIPGNDEVVIPGVTGLLIPPKDPGALAEAIRRVLAEPALAERMGQAGREIVVQKFSIKKMVEEVTHVYADCLGGNG